MPLPHFKVFNKKKNEPRLVLPDAPHVDSYAQRAEPVEKPPEVDVVIYRWHQTYQALCCPNCDAEIKKKHNYCKSCGWVMEDR